MKSRGKNGGVRRQSGEVGEERMNRSKESRRKKRGGGRSELGKKRERGKGGTGE